MTVSIVSPVPGCPELCDRDEPAEQYTPLTSLMPARVSHLNFDSAFYFFYVNLTVRPGDRNLDFEAVELELTPRLQHLLQPECLHLSNEDISSSLTP